MNESQGQGPVVLVVEDEAMIRMLAADMLEELGGSIIEAEAGAEALDIARSDPRGFDLAMVDLGLPDMNGEDLILELRRLRADMPILVTTGRDAESVPSLAEEQGLVFLGKPYQMAELERALAEVNLSGRQADRAPSPNF
jgi:DNA-binding response OmpR family regulator